jgi:RNase P subunit RPR2
MAPFCDGCGTDLSECNESHSKMVPPMVMVLCGECAEDAGWIDHDVYDWIQCPNCHTSAVNVTRNVGDKGGIESFQIDCESCGNVENKAV